MGASVKRGLKLSILVDVHQQSGIMLEPPYGCLKKQPALEIFKKVFSDLKGVMGVAGVLQRQAPFLPVHLLSLPWGSGSAGLGPTRGRRAEREGDCPTAEGNAAPTPGEEADETL